MGKLPRRDAIRRLYGTLAEAPPNLASLTIRPDGTVEASFREVAPETPIGPAAPPPPKPVPGSIFPDDDSPINAADLTLNPPDLEERN